MELFLDLILTISLSLIVTTLFIKLVSMQPLNTNNDTLTEESLMIDKFQRMPFEEEVIKLEERPSEGDSSVELYNVLGVKKEDYKFQDVVVVDSSKQGETEDGVNGDYDMRFGPEEGNGGERNLYEIEIESAEDEEEKEENNGIMDDWEEIGRKDFEELLGNKTGVYCVGVGDYGK